MYKSFSRLSEWGNNTRIPITIKIAPMKNSPLGSLTVLKFDLTWDISFIGFVKFNMVTKGEHNH